MTSDRPTTMTTVAVVVVVMCLSLASSEDVSTRDASHKYSGKVLLVSMDGFRWDYLRTVSGLGNFSRMASTGCTVDYMKSPFATKTFPCHYTLATGLFEESHGIVSNHMYDPVLNLTFGKDSLQSFWWDQGEPIWVTAEKHNKKTGVYFWPGSEAKIRNYRPSKYLAYNQSVPFPARVDTALGWLKNEGMDLVLLYFHEPDRTGHDFGPRSKQVADKVREMDGILGLILNSMEEMKLTDVNIILVSDHGMTDVNAKDRLLNLWEFVNQTTVKMVPDSGSVTSILPVSGREEEVYSASQKIPHVTVYKKEDIPDHFHYQDNPRIMPIIILADEGWLLSADVAKVRADNESGDHGYSNDLPSMRAIFFARGPDFRAGVRSDYIQSIDIYPLICRLLSIEPSPNNGSLERTAHFLATSGASWPVAGGTFTWLSVCVCVWFGKDWYRVV